MASKKNSLKKAGSLNKAASRVKDPLFIENVFFDPYDIVQVKYEMLRRVSHDGQSVTNAAAEFALSRPSFYEAKEALDKDGLPGLVPKKKGPRRAHKLSEKVLAFVVEKFEEKLHATEIATEVEKKFEIKIHPRSIEKAISKKK